MVTDSHEHGSEGDGEVLGESSDWREPGQIRDVQARWQAGLEAVLAKFETVILAQNVYEAVIIAQEEIRWTPGREESAYEALIIAQEDIRRNPGGEESAESGSVVYIYVEPDTTWLTEPQVLVEIAIRLRALHRLMSRKIDIDDVDDGDFVAGGC